MQMMVTHEVDVNFICQTDGKGYWSRAIAAVNINKLQLIAYPNNAFGELQVYFDDSWQVSQFGLIYTDDLWLQQFRKGLLGLGFSMAAVMMVDYSEQGMQGRDYVSLDVKKGFIQEYRSMYHV